MPKKRHFVIKKEWIEMCLAFNPPRWKVTCHAITAAWFFYIYRHVYITIILVVILWYVCNLLLHVYRHRNSSYTTRNSFPTETRNQESDIYRRQKNVKFFLSIFPFSKLGEVHVYFQSKYIYIKVGSSQILFMNQNWAALLLNKHCLSVSLLFGGHTLLVSVA